MRSVLLYSELGVLLKRHLISWYRECKCKCFYDNKHVSFFKKKSRMARVKLTLQANNYTVYIIRQGILNSIELRTKKTSNLIKNSNVIKQKFVIFLYIKLNFLRFSLIFRDIILKQKTKSSCITITYLWSIKLQDHQRQQPNFELW